MKITIIKDDISTVKADICSIGVTKSKELDAKPILRANDGGKKFDTLMNGELEKSVKLEDLPTSAGKYTLYFTAGKLNCRYLLIMGIDSKKIQASDFVKIGASIAKAVNKVKAKKVALVLEDKKWSSLSPEFRIAKIVEGIKLGEHKFENYKSKKNNFKLDELIISTKAKKQSVEKAINEGMLFGNATNYARDLSFTPAHDLTPKDLANEAQKISKENGLTFNVLNKSEIKKEKMDVFLAVAQGSTHEPVFIKMSYRPRGAKKKIALVGKGITFDSGGLCIKTAKGMIQMKDDMSGASTVMAIMKLVGVFKPKVEVHAYIPACENMPSGNAIKPGDIIKARSGKTVEIVNTDAEGRLILADALDYALENKPDYMIDIATLTGGVTQALGDYYTAILGNDERLTKKIISSAYTAGEKIWELPLDEDYLDKYKKSIADIKNSTFAPPSTISGGLFLHEFVGKTKWAHLDIAAASWSESNGDVFREGPTGSMVRTVFEFIRNI